MHKQIGKWADPILLIGLLVSILIAIGMVLIGNDTLSSFIIGLLSTIITLLIDLVARINKAESNLIGAQKLAQILSNEPISQDLQELARNYGLIKEYDFDLYQKIAFDSINQCKRRFRELASGVVVVPSKSVYDYNITGIKQARHTIKVTHITSPNYWNSDAGKKFLETSQSALERGVETILIFAISDEEIQEFKEVFKAQKEVGVRVSFTKPKRIDREFMLIDDKVLLEYEFDQKENTWIKTIILDQEEVKKAVDDFQYFITYAKPLSEETIA